MKKKRTQETKHEEEQPKRASLSERLLIPRHKTQEFQISQPGSGVQGKLRSQTLEEPVSEPSGSISSRKRNEMLGVLYLAFALLLMAGIGVEQTGSTTSRLHQMLDAFIELNGIGPFFISGFAAYCGVCRLQGKAVFENEIQMLSFPVLYFSFIGSVASFFGPGENHTGPGGIVGNYIYWYLQPVFGVLGSRIVLLSSFVVAGMHVTEIYASDVLRMMQRGGCWLGKMGWHLLCRSHDVLVALMQDLIILVEKGLASMRSDALQREPESPPEIQSTAIEETSPKLPELYMPADEEKDFPKVSAFEIPVPPEPESNMIEPAEAEEPVDGEEANPIYLPAPRELKTRVETFEKQDGLRVATLIDEEIEDAQWEAMQQVDPQADSVIPESTDSVEQPSAVEVSVSVEKEPVSKPIEETTGESAEIQELRDFSKTLHIEESEDPVEDAQLPKADFLAQPPTELEGDSEDELWERGSLLIKALDNYKVNSLLHSFVQGPTITRFELKPAAGTKLNKILNLTNEIAMALAAQSVRIEAPIPGTSKVGIEIPNTNPVPVYYSEIVQKIKGEGKADLHPLTIAFGKNIAGEPVIGNLAKMPHLMVAGATGSGKSVCVNTIISSILFRARPDEVKFVMIDPKQVELAVYRGIPHLITDVVTAPEEASAALMWGVEEMEKRYTLLSQFGVRHIDNFNIKVKEGTLEPIEEVESIPAETLPYVVIIVDELADLMMVAKKDVETSICRIAQKARAVGIHLVIATQRPSVDVITGLIKANLPSRIAFMVKSAIDSRTILDQMGAELLLGRGDMLYYPGGQPKPERVQGAFMNDDEVAELVKRIKRTFGEGEYQDIISPYMESEEEASEDSTDFYDDKFNLALEVAIREGYVSTSMLQRHLGIGYNRAARIVDVMFAREICGPQESGKKRKILITLAELEQHTI